MEKYTNGMNKQLPKERIQTANKHVLNCSKKRALFKPRCYFLPFKLVKNLWVIILSIWKHYPSMLLIKMQISKTHLTSNLPVCVKDSKDEPTNCDSKNLAQRKDYTRTRGWAPRMRLTSCWEQGKTGKAEKNWLGCVVHACTETLSNYQNYVTARASTHQ